MILICFILFIYLLLFFIRAFHDVERSLNHPTFILAMKRYLECRPNKENLSFIQNKNGLFFIFSLYFDNY